MIEGHLAHSGRLGKDSTTRNSDEKDKEYLDALPVPLDTWRFGQIDRQPPLTQRQIMTSENNLASQDGKVTTRNAIVVFKVNVAETCAGEYIKVVGSHPALGEWSAAKGIPLTTDSRIYPSWRATVLIQAPVDCDTFSFDYKYVRDRRGLDVQLGMEFVWEERSENRRATVSIEHPYKEHIVQDEYLGEGSCKLYPLFSSRGRKQRSLGPRHAPIDCMATFEEKYDVTDYEPIAGGGASTTILWCQSRYPQSLYVVKQIDRAILLKDEKKNLFGIRSRQGEIELHAQLNHPNILRLMEVFVNPERVSLVLEACCGGDIHDCVRKHRTSTGLGLPELVVATFAQQMLKALEFLHAGGIVHRDVKSENLMVLEKDVSLEHCAIKLGDFGFAACLHQCKGGFLRTVMGSPNYVAPEVIRGQHYATSVDVWSSGVVFHHMLVGFLPFRAPTSKQTLKKVQVGMFKTDGSAWREIPEAAKDLLCSLMCFDVQMRLRAIEALRHRFFLIANPSGKVAVPESVSSVGRQSTMCASDGKDVDSLSDTEDEASEKQAKDMERCFALSEASSSTTSIGSASARRNEVADAMDQMLQEGDGSSSSDVDDGDDRKALDPFIYTPRTAPNFDHDKDDDHRACFHPDSESPGLITALHAIMHYIKG